MERDAILGHGASFFLKERLCALSDAFKTVACINCGNFATAKVLQDKIVCQNCPHKIEKDNFGQITVPYAFTLLRNLLAGLNIELKFDFKDQTYIIGNENIEEFDQDLIELSDQPLLPGDEDELDPRDDYEEIENEEEEDEEEEEEEEA